jgi:preprotein translocase subunit SecF
MFVIKHRKIFYSLSVLIVAFSIFATSFWGINFGVDFTGGSLLEVQFSTEARPEKEMVEQTLDNLNLDRDFSVRATDDDGYVLRSKVITDEEKNTIISTLNAEEIRFNTIGPTLGNELRSKALVSVLVIVLSIIIFVAIAFSQVSKPVSSWKYGLVAILAFVHDVLVPVGLFAILGQFFAVEVDTLFIIAILVVLGYSINDTIVVFDRIRENLKNIPEKKRNERFEEVVGKSLKQTFGRSINTSITTLLALLALFIFGGEATKWFALALIAGIISGTYSSIFFAAPMLVTFHRLGKNKSK